MTLNENKDSIKPYNDKGQKHGEWILLNEDGDNIISKGVYDKNIQVGLWVKKNWDRDGHGTIYYIR